jgi:transcriptional regulator with XRE-family HTH domain
MFTFVILIIYIMKERLLEFLKNENKSSAQLAEEIGVQASGISHILSGRNNPSLDFVLKMLEKYQFLSTDWLLFGKGTMYKEARMQNLFDYDPDIKTESKVIQIKSDINQHEVESSKDVKSKTLTDSSVYSDKTSPEVIKIVWFYENNSFKEFTPEK